MQSGFRLKILRLGGFPLLTLILLAAGCLETPPAPSLDSPSLGNGQRSLQGVKFVRQRDEFCGPAAMESVMNYYGEGVSQDEIAGSVYTPKLGGALISDMQYFAQERGFRAETINGDFDAIASAIDSGAPVIALVDVGKFGLSAPHYYVVYGYDKAEGALLLHTGYRGNVRMKLRRFEREWSKMNRLMLVIHK
ncbi:MAG: cysteine peptidase family C39 domain-containing protein [Deltaproteobacteria bacterium]